MRMTVVKSGRWIASDAAEGRQRSGGPAIFLNRQFWALSVMGITYAR